MDSLVNTLGVFSVLAQNKKTISVVVTILLVASIFVVVRSRVYYQLDGAKIRKKSGISKYSAAL